MNLFEILSLALTAMLVVVGAPAILSLRNQLSKDREDKIRKDAIDEERLSELRKDVDHAHNRLRVIETDNVNTKVLMERFTTSLEEATRILRRVEEKIDGLHDLEARLDAHIEAHK